MRAVIKHRAIQNEVVFLVKLDKLINYKIQKEKQSTRNSQDTAEGVAM